jgi:DNA-binding NarL/FixJ family response regulator
MTVFLTDDSKVIIERLQEMLSALPGIQMAGTALDVPEAIRSIHDTKPEAVILDLHLPAGSGLEVLQKVKGESPETIVIILTNYAFPQYKKRCTDAGADAFLDKSTQFTEVAQVLRQLGIRAGYIEAAPSFPPAAP